VAVNVAGCNEIFNASVGVSINGLIIGVCGYLLAWRNVACGVAYYQWRMAASLFGWLSNILSHLNGIWRNLGVKIWPSAMAANGGIGWRGVGGVFSRGGCGVTSAYVKAVAGSGGNGVKWLLANIRQ